MLDPETTRIIANPNAAGGRVGRELESIQTRMRDALGEVVTLLTEGPRHATTLTEQAVRDGATTILSMGGDGTHNEVVNGIMLAEPPPGAVTLGILPAGTGGDFRRMLIHGDTLDESAVALPTASAAPIDVGHVQFQNDDGQSDERYFINIASFGVAGLVDRYVSKSSKLLNGTITFYISTLRALARYKPARVRIEVDGQDIGTYAITNVMVCNGRFAGGGMKFAPDAHLADGLFDVVVAEHRSVAYTLSLTPNIYKGTHIGKPGIRVFRGREVRAETLTEHPAWMDVDGEAPGQLPAHFRIHPGAIQLLGARPDVL